MGKSVQIGRVGDAGLGLSTLVGFCAAKVGSWSDLQLRIQFSAKTMYPQLTIK